MTSYSFL